MIRICWQFGGVGICDGAGFGGAGICDGAGFCGAGFAVGCTCGYDRRTSFQHRSCVALLALAGTKRSF